MGSHTENTELKEISHSDLPEEKAITSADPVELSIGILHITAAFHTFISCVNAVLMGAKNTHIELKKIIDSIQFGEYSNVFSSVGGILSLLTGYLSVYTDYINLDNVQYRKSDRQIKIAVDFAMTTQTSATTLATLLVQFGAIHGIAAAVCAPAGAIGGAVAAWATAGKSLYHLDRAVKKTDPHYFLAHKIKKYNSIREKLHTIQSGLNDPKVSAKFKEILKTRKKEFEEAQQKTLRDAVIFYKAYKNGNVKKTGKIKTFLEQNERPTVLKKLKIDINAPITPAEKNYVTYLENRQREKVLIKALDSVSSIMVAVGMTFLVAAPFFAPLMIPAIILCAVGGLMKLSEALVPLIANKIIEKQSLNKYLENYNLSHPPVIDAENILAIKLKIAKDLLETEPKFFNEKLKLNLSLDASKINLANNISNVNQKFDSMPEKEKDKFLDAVIKKHRENHILNKRFGSDYDKLNLSDKTKQKIISTYLREKTFGFFYKPSDHLKTVQEAANSPHPHPHAA